MSEKSAVCGHFLLFCVCSKLEGITYFLCIFSDYMDLLKSYWYDIIVLWIARGARAALCLWLKEKITGGIYMRGVMRSRNIAFVLYPEDKTHEMALNILRQSPLQWCAILHDKDYENGNLKKAHWHGLIRFSNAQTLAGVASRLGVAVNYLQSCSDAVSYCQYLCHCGDLDKFQYPDTDIFGPFSDSARSYVLQARNCQQIVRISESEAFGEILQFISDFDGLLEFKTLCAWAVSVNLWGYFRQNFSIVRELVREHNAEFERSLHRTLGGESSCDGFKAYVIGCGDGARSYKRKHLSEVMKTL